MGKKIMVVKLGGIGDVIMATSILAELKRIYPDSFITLMTYYNAFDVVSGLPFVDEVFPYDKKKDGFRKLFCKMLGKDLAIFLDLSYRPALVAALARVPVRVGLEHKRKFWLSHPVKWREEMDHTYEPEVFAQILEEGIDLRLDRKALQRPYISPAGEAEAAALQKRLWQKGLAAGEGYVVCSPITAYYLKNWPLEKWKELFGRIYKDFGLKTVVFGGGRLDFAWGEAVVDMYGDMNLRQVGHLIKGARLLVNSCSMPEHMAAALGIPCVIMYGYAEPKRWAPREKCLWVQTELSCAPCDGYRGSTCTDPRCMKEMTVERVYQACCQMLNREQV